MVLHSCVGLNGGFNFGCVLGGGGCAFVLVDLDALRHLIYNEIGVMEAQFVDSFASFLELKVSFLEGVFEFIPYFVCRISAFPRPDVNFENLLFVENNKGKVYCLALG